MFNLCKIEDEKVSFQVVSAKLSITYVDIQLGNECITEQLFGEANSEAHGVEFVHCLLLGILVHPVGPFQSEMEFIQYFVHNIVNLKRMDHVPGIRFRSIFVSLPLP